MPLTSGAKLGSYEILSPLGAGGMGEVYRARDSKLNREVALKVLPTAFASDAERMARFQREAQLLASLNHPNIASIYGLEESDSVRALVMELVEGPTLAELLETRNSKLETRNSASVPAASFDFRSSDFDPLLIAKQIAEALEYAHERGIIHRDLKPANIKITPDGEVKVLDFGLAKALASEASGTNLANSPTISIAATQAGVILGTAAYMSPEQAKGKAVDRRTDIWAFGCVLYEILTGKPTFEGETVSDVLAAVIMRDPDWSAVPQSTPVAIQRLVRRCLIKDPKQRLRDIGEARIAIEETLNGTEFVAAVSDRRTDEKIGDHRSPLRRALPWVVAGLTTVAMLIALYAYWRTARFGWPAPVELSLNLPSTQQLFTTDGPAMVLSPDGSRIAYAVETSPGIGQIYVRELDKAEGAPLQGAEGSAPFFSPDGQWIGYFGSDGKLYKISVFGGAPVALCNADSRRGASWGEDGTIVFTPTFTSPLYRTSPVGGTPVIVTHLDAGKAEVSHRWPQILPGGKTVIFTGSSDNNNFEYAEVEAASLSTGEAKVLVENAYFGRYLPSGYLTYVSEGTLFAVPFDPKEVKLSGTAAPVLPNIQADLNNGSAQFSFSGNGTAAYLKGQGLSAQVTVALVDRKGVATPLIQQPGNYFAARFSPDGKRLALQDAGNVLVYDLARATLTPLTFSNPECTHPVWTPDNRRITCFRDSALGIGPGISWLPSDGSGSMETLTKGATVRQFPFSWSPNGKTLAFAQFSQKTGGCCEIWMLPMGPNGQPGTPIPFLKAETSELGGGGAPAFSPDGRWLAYQGYASGVIQVYVVPYPGPGGRWQVSVSGGLFPTWSKTGHELFFLQGGLRGQLALEEVAYSVEGNSFQPGKPTVLFHGDFEMRQPLPGYDVAPDGKHFAMFEPVGERTAAPAPPTVVLNWFTRVAAMVATSQK